MKNLNLKYSIAIVSMLFVMTTSFGNNILNNESEKKDYNEMVVTKEPTDTMKVNNINDFPLAKTPHNVDVRKIYDKNTALAVHIKLEPGESLKPHITPVDVFFYVLEGTPEIMVGNETRVVEADCIVDSPKDIPHTISNKSDKVARILVVKAPKPTTETKLL